MAIIQGGVVLPGALPRPVNPFGVNRLVQSTATLQAAINAAQAGDVIYVEPGSYDEQVTISKSNITIVGIGGRGAVAIAPTAANPTAIKIDGTTGTRITDVTLVNLGIEASGTGIGLHIKGDVRRIRVYGCKIEGGTDAVKLESTAQGALSDNRFEDCELCWTGTAIHIAVSGGGNPVTQTLIRRCLLHNYSARGIHVDTTHTADLWVEDNFFAVEEDGTAPTNEIVKADVASTTGFFGGNKFATATNAASVLAIATGVLWGPNGTQAGWSTARPA